MIDFHLAEHLRGSPAMRYRAPASLPPGRWTHDCQTFPAFRSIWQEGKLTNWEQSTFGKSKDQKSFAVGQFSFWEVVYDALTITILAINIIIVVVILIITIIRLPSSTRKPSAQTFLKNPASPVQGSSANLDDDDKTMVRIIMIVIVTSPIFYIFDIM